MTRKEWIEQAKAKLDRWDHKVSAMEARAASMSEEAKAEYHEMAAEARERLEEAKTQVAEAEDAGGDAWEDLGNDLQSKWEENKKAVDQALKKMAPGPAESA